jgi:predicted amidohydrolase
LPHTFRTQRGHRNRRFDPDGRIVMAYLKEHPVARWEAGIMRSGRGGIQIAPTAAGRIGGAICFDADFPEFIRTAGRDDFDVFVLPANEWRAIKDVALAWYSRTGDLFAWLCVAGVVAVFAHFCTQLR